MRKTWKVLFTTLSVFCIMLTVIACGNGADILTEVTLEDDFSGSRVMDVSISKEAFEEYFTGEFEDIENVISDNCPEELDYELTESETSLICIFTLEFDSVETYKDKVESILGEERELHVLKTDSFLSKGIAYEENFTSEELLSWFSEALVEEGFVSSDNQSEIFESDTTKFIFDSVEYDTTEEITVSDIEYYPFGEIDILSKPYNDGTYDRTVVFNIPQFTMDEKGDEVTTFLEDGLPSDANKEWEDGVDGEIFTIEMSRMTVDELDSAMKKIFHSEISSVENLKYSGETNMIEFGHALTETIDASNFISDDMGTTYVNYYISDDVDPIVEEVHEDGWTTEIFSSWSDNYPGYQRVFNDYISQMTLNVEAKISYIPDTINITTEVKGKDKLERDIEFIYSENLEEAELLQLEESISEAIDDYGEVEKITDDDKNGIVLKQEGTVEEVNLGFQTIFDSPNSFTYYNREEKRFAFRINSEFEEQLILSNFFGGNINYIEVNYTAKLPAGEKISDSTIDNYEYYDDVTIDDNTINRKFYGEYIGCNLTASGFNAIAILWWALVVILVLAVVLGGYVGYRKLAKTKKGSDFNKKTLKKTLKKKQCNNCKAYIDDNVKYCTKCGTEYKEIKEPKSSDDQEE